MDVVHGIGHCGDVVLGCLGLGDIVDLVCHDCFVALSMVGNNRVCRMLDLLCLGKGKVVV